MAFTPPKIEFIGRKKERADYRKFLDEETPWLFLLTGMPGTGKSTLLNYYEDHAEILHIKLDFANQLLPTDPLKILEALSWRLASYCNPQKVADFDETLQKARRQTAQYYFNSIPPLSSFNVSQFSTLEDYITGEIDINTKNAERAEQLLLEEVEFAFYVQIQTFTQKKLVILLDTCEWLNEREEHQHSEWLTDRLVPQLHRYLHCHILIASRTYPQLKKVAQQDQLMYPLPMLDRESVLTYLQEIGVEDEQDREKIFSLTHGHSLCLSIISTLWQIREEEEKVFDEPLEKEYTEEALVELVQDRLDHRLKGPFRTWTHYGVLLRRFNWELMCAVFPETLEAPDVYGSFEQFSDYSYIKDIGARYYVIHELFREVLVENIRIQEPDQWHLYHQRAFNYWANRSNPEQYYYTFALDDHKGIIEWYAQVQRAIQTGNIEDGNLLLTLPLDHVFQLSTFGQGIYHQAWGDNALNKGQLEEALEQYKKALLRFQQTTERAYEAQLYKIIGDLHKDLAQWLAALAHYEQARQLFHTLDDSKQEALVLQARGDIQRSNNETEALQSFELALVYFRQLHERFYEATVLYEIGKLKFQSNKQWSDAFRCYTQAQVIFHALHEQKNEALAWQAMGDIKRLHRMTVAERLPHLFHKISPSGAQQSRIPAWQEAIDYYENALALFSAVADNQNVINILQSIGEVNQQHKRPVHAHESYQAALELYQQVNSDIGENLRKSEAELFEKIGSVQETLFERKDAQENYLQSFQRFTQINENDSASRMFQAIKGTQPFTWWRKRFGLPALLLTVIILSVTLTSIGFFQSYQYLQAPCLAGQVPPSTIGITETAAACGQESIGVSDGSYVFDTGQGSTNSGDKNLAASAQQAHDISDAIYYWQAAYNATTADAEPLIYQEDLHVLQTRRPYITLVVVTSLTPTNGIFSGGGRDLLQGSYLAQHAYNQKCESPKQSCPLLHLLIANIGSNADYASFIAKQIINVVHNDHTIIGVVGFLNSAPTVDAVPLLQAAQIPILSSTATSDELTGISPYFFRIPPSDTQQGAYGASYAQNTLHVKNVVVFADQSNAYSESLAHAFEMNFKGESVTSKAYAIGDDNDLLNAVKDALRSHPDLIYFAGYARDASTLLLYLDSQHSATLLMGGDALFIPGDYTPAAKNSNFHNFYFTSFTYINPNKPQDNSAQANIFLQAYSETFDPHYQHLRTYGYSLADTDTILTYDAINTYIQAYQNALVDAKGAAITPNEIRTGLSQIDSKNPYTGISGTIAFAANGNSTSTTVLMLNGQPNSQTVNDVHVVGSNQ